MSRFRAVKFEALLILPLLVLGLGIVACDEGDSDDEVAGVPADAGSPVSGSDANVEVVDNHFEPKELTVKAGTTVTWVWRGEAEHSVRGTEPDFVSDTQAEGGFEYTFEFSGRYPYHCEVHGPDAMSGIVIVVP